MHFKEVVLVTASLALFPVGNLTLPREEVKFTLTPSRMKKDSLEDSRASLEHYFLHEGKVLPLGWSVNGLLDFCTWNICEIKPASPSSFVPYTNNQFP
ncbi:hypothetical protein OOU_Y34scaffold01015g4 [Pyricularia oryzae Y34]|uniref:Uncharacterized protein n=2 Tax=Pyricularia oryzae TaxID=318829 RepID=A0AA97PFQ8_PYRO3|nr:hypothetical protein OOU_Y34scaffold01015g4 [Pyricularia oryzae Y34]